MFILESVEEAVILGLADKLFWKLDKIKVNVSGSPLRFSPESCTSNLLCATTRGTELEATSRRRVEMAMSVLSLVRCATAGPTVQSVPPLLFADHHSRAACCGAVCSAMVQFQAGRWARSWNPNLLLAAAAIPIPSLSPSSRSAAQAVLNLQTCTQMSQLR